MKLFVLPAKFWQSRQINSVSGFYSISEYFIFKSHNITIEVQKVVNPFVFLFTKLLSDERQFDSLKLVESGIVLQFDKISKNLLSVRLNLIF